MNVAMQLTAINDRFAEAREEISIANDDAETTYIAYCMASSSCWFPNPICCILLTSEPAR